MTTGNGLTAAYKLASIGLGQLTADGKDTTSGQRTALLFARTVLNRGDPDNLGVFKVKGSVNYGKSPGLLLRHSAGLTRGRPWGGSTDETIIRIRLPWGQMAGVWHLRSVDAVRIQILCNGVPYPQGAETSHAFTGRLIWLVWHPLNRGSGIAPRMTR